MYTLLFINYTKIKVENKAHKAKKKILLLNNCFYSSPVQPTLI